MDATRTSLQVAKMLEIQIRNCTSDYLQYQKNNKENAN